MAHKTRQAALKAARSDLGDEAIEGVDFQLRNTGAGWAHESIPPANENAAKAQAKRVRKPKDPNAETREQKRQRLIREADERNAAKARGEAPEPKKAKDHPTPIADARVEAKINVAAKRAARKAAPKAVEAGAQPGEKLQSASKEPSKTDMLVKLMSRKQGATSKAMEEAAGWLPHSVRGLIGTLKKKGVNIVSTKTKGEPTVYHIPGETKAKAPAVAEVGDVI